MKTTQEAFDNLANAADKLEKELFKPIKPILLYVLKKLQKFKEDKMANKFKDLRDQLTAENNHTDAMIVECLELGRYDLIEDLTRLAQIHEEQGYLTEEQQNYRDNVIAAKMVGGI